MLSASRPVVMGGGGFDGGIIFGTIMWGFPSVTIVSDSCFWQVYEKGKSAGGASPTRNTFSTSPDDGILSLVGQVFAGMTRYVFS